ncbi:hypothetical protein CPB84DRAFT_768296 [Gymnopilus junonius]|uniref:Uncharacterized protein n=1 Tax=Gymnopilus junonius TaxID=109634 RepID=A0A9P5TPW0_GYMJU|nr:hypothetical protein CPB84DRAFT_768296 [Gymnopilus junonius]
MSTTGVLVSNDPFVRNILDKFTELNRLSPADIANIYQQIEKQAQTASVRHGVREEVRELGEALIVIEDDFSTVGDQLSGIDEKKVVLVDGKPKAYAPLWNALHDEYSQLMRLSQTTANTVKSKIDVLLKQIIPIIRDQACSLAERKGVLQRYIKNLTRFKDSGSQVEDHFQSLGQRVGQFRDDLKRDVTNQLDSSETERKIDEINKKIETLREELRRRLLWRPL